MIGERTVSRCPLLDRVTEFLKLSDYIRIGGGNEFWVRCRDAFGKAPGLEDLAAKSLMDGPSRRIGTASATYANRRGQVVENLSQGPVTESFIPSPRKVLGILEHFFKARKNDASP